MHKTVWNSYSDGCINTVQDYLMKTFDLILNTSQCLNTLSCDLSKQNFNTHLSLTPLRSDYLCEVSVETSGFPKNPRILVMTALSEKGVKQNIFHTNTKIYSYPSGNYFDLGTTTR